MTRPRPRRFKRRRPSAFNEAAYVVSVKREIVDRFGTWELCGRWPCWRAKACRTPGVDCFDEHREVIQDCIVDEAHASYRIAGIAEDLLPEEA